MKKLLIYAIAFLTVFCIFPANAASENSADSDDWYVEIIPGKITLLIGETFSVPLRFYPEEPQNYRLEWSSSDPEVATVNESGVIEAIATGQTTIAVRPEGKPLIPFGSELTVIVDQNDVNHIKIKLESESLSDWMSTDNVTLFASRVPYAYPYEAWLKGKNITSEAKWTSSDENVAVLTSDKLIKVIGYGETIITASYNLDGTDYSTSVKIVGLEKPDPILNPATDVSENGFTISWQPSEMADRYIVQVWYYSEELEKWQYYKRYSTDAPDCSVSVSITPGYTNKYRYSVEAVLAGAYVTGYSGTETVEIDPSGVEGIEAEQPSAAGIDYAQPYEVYTLDGRLAGNTLAPLAKGIYILRQNGAAVKVAKRD